MDKWTELRTAYLVAKHGTVSGAAQALGLHRATVNRHIDLLESEIGARIFIRHARGYTLTDVGHDVLRVAQKAEELIEDLAGRVQGEKSQLSGEIKLTILAPFATMVMGAIAEFRDNNPHCQVHIDVGEGLARLEYGEAHIALRAGARPEHPDYVVSSFGEIGVNLYAHESYIARHGLPTQLHEMAEHSFVLPQFPNARLPFGDWIETHVRPEQIALASRDVRVAAEAIQSGLGLGFMSLHDAQNRGNLRAVLPPNPDWTAQSWLVTHVDLHRTEKVQAMLACLKSVSPLRQR